MSNEPTTTPPRRKPLVGGLVPVPGPNSGGIAQRAIEMREQARALTPKEEAAPGHVNLQPLRNANAPVYVERSSVGEITGAVAKVMAEVGTIQKTGYNKFHGYHYASMADVFHAVTPLMGKHGLMYTQTEIEVKPIENNRLAVLYEFVFSHVSGETLPPTRFTSLVMARDSKGNYDDKAINKAHSNARKYVIIGLFNVPAGDFDEADQDEDNANQRKERRPVPGPSSPPPQQASAGVKPISQEVQAASSDTLIEEGLPHKLVVPQGTTADGWAKKYLDAIKSAQNRDEVRQWEEYNDGFLQRISDGYPSIYEMISQAVTNKLAELEGTPNLAQVWADPQEAMNWVASQLQQIKTDEAVVAFWDQVVVPQRENFDESDWAMLLDELQRNRDRVAATS